MNDKVTMRQDQPYRIVVVDDEAMSETYVRHILGAEGMQVEGMRSGQELLRFLEKNTPDLILLDIMMPEMDGFETYDALRKLEEQTGKPPIPVIFLTGEDDRETEHQGLKLGASDFIRKPIDRGILLKRIENTITNSRTIETLAEEAMLDLLTGFLNKTHGTEQIAKLCGQQTGALMIMDLDNFKLVNDLFGHDMGDRVLKAFAGIIRDHTEETDTVSRIGGDEFLAFYKDLTDEDTVAALTKRLNARLQEATSRFMGPDHGIPLGVSVGAVMVPGNGRDYASLFALADDALYTVKRAGKHGYHLYSGMPDTETGAADPEERLERTLGIMRERSAERGAMMLGSDPFATVCRFMMQYFERFGGTAVLLLFTLMTEKNEDQIRIPEACAAFGGILERSLGTGDIVTRSGTDSFLVLLAGRTKAEAQGAEERILAAWEETEYRHTLRIGHALRYID